MPFVNLKFEIFPIKNIYGKKTGRVYCVINNTQVEGDSREDLEKRLSDFVSRAVNFPRVRAFHQNGEIRILQEIVCPEGNAIETRKGEIQKDSPKIILRSVSTTGRSLDEETDTALMNIAQQEWNAETGADTWPDWLPERLWEDFRRWTEWQRRYKAEIDAGKTDHEAHAIACGLGHLLK